MSENKRSNGPQKKGGKKWPLIIGGVVIVLGVGGFFGYRAYSSSQNLQAAKKVVADFTDSLTAADYEALPDLLVSDESQKSDYSDQEIVEKYQAVYGGVGAENISVENISVTASDEGYDFTYDLSMTTSVGELPDLQYSGTVVLEEGAAKLNWAPSLVFPEMSGQDKVSVAVDEAVRGEILDRNQRQLAANGQIYQLGVVPGNLGEGDARTENIAAIAERFSLEVATIEAALEQEWVQPDYFVPLKVVDSDSGDVPEGAVTATEELPTGADIRPVAARTYPLGEAAAHLIGYVGQVTAEDLENDPTLPTNGEIGRAGLEATFDGELRGKNGGSITITDEEGNLKSTLVEAEKTDGQTIHVTIDSQAQQIAYDALGGQAGSTVVTQPMTGDLIVATSSPSFDPNKMTQGISQTDYDAYANNPELPFISRFATGYAPGSTFKVITSAIGLDNGTITADEEVSIEGLKWQQDASWGDYQVTRVSDVNPVNLRSALVYSDNIYMAQETLKMGETAFREGLNKFIFGETLDLPIAMNPAQISNEDSFNSEILLADTGYGQGELLINPIQQATIYSVFANEGTLVYPRLIKDAEIKTKDAVVSADAVATIVADMQAVVTDANGTAHSLNSLGIPIAAKTGTAEIKETQDESGQENSFLLAFIPEKKNYLAISMMENSQDSTSAKNTAPALLQYLNGLM
ncbi:penicillin-binding protein PBP4(5) [Enterococcus sp. LJL90]